MVSVIILNYNGRKNLGKLLEDCLESVLNTNYPNFEVLFLDNASTDDNFDPNKKLRITQSNFSLPTLKNYVPLSSLHEELPFYYIKRLEAKQITQNVRAIMWVLSN